MAKRRVSGPTYYNRHPFYGNAHPMTFIRMSELDLHDQRVLIREDLNVPVKDGKITSTQRLEAALPTIRAARDAGAGVLVMSHLGRPKEGHWDEAGSLKPVAAWLSHALGSEVPLVRDYLDGIEAAPGHVVLLENCRMNVGEDRNDDALAQKYAAMCDVFVMDAFGTAHRAQASTHGVAKFAKVACAGPLLAAELDALALALQNPKRPLLAIVAGSKVSTKLELLTSLVQNVDRLILGGGIANTFIAAAGFPVGKSLYEPELLGTARKIVAEAEARDAEIPLPKDVVVAPEFKPDAPAKVKRLAEIGPDDMILDIGPETREQYAKIIGAAGTIVWNGPVGVFEFDKFGDGTAAVAKAVAASPAFSIAGGGDTLAAIEKYGVADKIGYISTGGGAFLEFLEGKELPAVTVLRERAEAK